MFTTSRCFLHFGVFTHSHILQVGQNIDIAFLVLCAHAMDQMFYDKDYD